MKIIHLRCKNHLIRMRPSWYTEGMNRHTYSYHGTDFSSMGMCTSDWMVSIG